MSSRTALAAQEEGSAMSDHTDPVAAVLNATKGFNLMNGRIVDVQRKTERGWALGEARIAGVDADAQPIDQFTTQPARQPTQTYAEQ